MSAIQLHYKKEMPVNMDYLANTFFVKDDPQNTIRIPNSQTITYNPFHIRNIQNYNPIYGKFFELTESNYDKITLNQKYGIRESSLVDRETGEKVDKPIFFKFAPLLDPIRYMIGKYDLEDPNLKRLPTISNSETCFPKIADSNNVSYIDSFFSFLGSQLLHKHNVFHATDFYGSYLGIQELFKTNVTDEMEYLHSSDFFEKHLNQEFYVENEAFAEYMDYGSRKHRKKIQIGGGDSCASRISLGAEEIGIDESICENTTNILSKTTTDFEEVYAKHNQSTSSKSSSSRSSEELNYSSDEDSSYSDEGEDHREDDHREDGDDDTKDEDPNHEDGDDDSGDYETVSSNETRTTESDEPEMYAFIKDFPTQMICLEKCDGTLDDLFMTGTIDVDQAAACLFQVIMSLIVFQKAFRFTHNDLHTNNIMYVNTEVEYVYYCYQSSYYRVPTYGRIFKIIDFGRSIYKFQGKTFCSDSFAPSGDAYAQYNCEPYMNRNKPRIDPNPSFDLCRLGCSIFDFIMGEDMEKIENELQQTISRWCSDDNGRNVLYKRNGDERYPNFKLYKMIARNVHKHTPQEQLKFPYFSQFEVSTKQLKEYEIATIQKNGINIDEIPSYVL
jgi:hypothetical protein